VRSKLTRVGAIGLRWPATGLTLVGTDSLDQCAALTSDSELAPISESTIALTIRRSNRTDELQ
jgi:hypothetical protein